MEWISLIISIVALVVAIFRKPKVTVLNDQQIDEYIRMNVPNWEYTKEGIIFYTRDGKKVLLEQKKL